MDSKYFYDFLLSYFLLLYALLFLICFYMTVDMRVTLIAD